MSYIEIVSGHTSCDGPNMDIHALANYGYGVQIQEDIFSLNNKELAKAIADRSCLVVISETIQALYGDRIQSYLDQNFDTGAYKVFVCPSGEKNKTMETVVEICAQAKDFQLDRDGLFIGVGGGIILDMVGFAASIYRRGTKYIKVPTTLVGQVDVAVGLKTGVNCFRSKNILGNYYPAYHTLNDRVFLETLPTRELRCGMAEVIKMAIVCDGDLFDKIERACLAEDEMDLSRIDYDIYKQAMVRMMEELQPNLLEANLERLVDFGHTFSMNFEIDSNHEIHHGEAVAIDMALSCCIARALGIFSEEECNRAIWVLKKSGLAIYDSAVCTIEALKRSIYDVRLHRKAVNLVVPPTIGQGVFIKSPDVLSDQLLEKSVNMLRSYEKNCVNTDNQHSHNAKLSRDSALTLVGA